MLTRISKLLLVFTLCGCGLRSAPSVQRKFIPDLAKGDKLTSSVPDFVDPVLLNNEVDACETLNKIAQNEGRDTYSYFNNLNSLFATNPPQQKNDMLGAVNIAESPLTQLFLTSFKAPTNEEFLRLVEEKYKKGELSSVKYYAVRAAAVVPAALTKIKFSQTSDALNDAFPGIFGQPADVSTSLFFSLAKKLDLKKNQPAALSLHAAPINLAKPLTSRLPLLPKNFIDIGDDFSFALRGALAGLDKNAKSNLAPACSLVLLHRAFAQILSIKGYVAPAIQTNSTIPAVASLNSDHTYFEGTPKSGYFFDLTSGQNAVLEANDIRNYDPDKKLMIVSNESKNTNLNKFAWLEQQLSLLRAMTGVFVATSPTITLQKNINYYLGDIKQPKNSALLPLEVNGLALGFISMIFKNLKKLNIQKIDSSGKPTEDEKATRGLMLTDSSSGAHLVTIDNTLSLIESSVRLEQSFQALEAKPVAFWSALNSDFNQERMATLKEFRLTLNKLIFPLTALAIKMGDSKGGCIGTAMWDANTGQLTPTAECTEDELTRFSKTMLLVAKATQSPGLYHRFN